jgi:MFS family permease
LVGGASLAGRRFGHHIGGWLVGLPLTSGPVAFFVATDQGVSFAGGAAVGMMAGTISQVVFALAYRAVARRGATRAFLAGSLAFAIATLALSFMHWRPLVTFGLVLAALIVGYSAGVRRADEPPSEPVAAPRWDIPVRMLAATSVVLLITGLAPILGPHLAGLLSPFPVFGAVLAIFTHHSHGARGASQVLAGLVLGLFAPAVFFLILAVMLPSVGFAAFALATTAALAAQGLTMLAIPREHQPSLP